jgi:hypothetical protein
LRAFIVHLSSFLRTTGWGEAAPAGSPVWFGKRATVYTCCIYELLYRKSHIRRCCKWTTSRDTVRRLGATLDEAAQVLDRFTADQLLAPYEIQGYHARGLDAIYHVVEHFGMHFGQIVYITKLLSGKDLGFYKELNQTGRA